MTISPSPSRGAAGPWPELRTDLLDRMVVRSGREMVALVDDDMRLVKDRQQDDPLVDAIQ